MSNAPIGSGLRLPLTILAVLIAMVVAFAGLMFGFTTTESLPLPSAIGPAGGPGKTVLTRTFTLDRPAGSGVLWLAVADSGRAEIGGVPVIPEARGTAVQGSIGPLQPGLHTVTVEVQGGAVRPLAIGYLEIDGMPGRIVTDGSWNVRTDAGEVSSAEVVARYGEPPFGRVFGELADRRSVPKDARFWTPLVALVVAMCVAALAGPLLRPAGRSGRDLEVLDLAVVVPSIVYGSAAFLITGLAGLGVGPGAILAMHVAATGAFVLILVAWKGGGRLVEKDRDMHRAELSGFDSFQVALELVSASFEGRSAEIRSAVRPSLHSLGEAIRYAATTAATPDLDREILEGLRSLEREAASPESSSADLDRRITAVVTLVRRREIAANAARRA